MADKQTCNDNCDFSQRQTLIEEAAPDSTVTITIQALYWGVYCSGWHLITVNSIGSSYPSHYVHFDREIALTGNCTLSSYYLTDNVIEIPRIGPPGNLSAYAFCYIPQQHNDSANVNHAFTATVCKNVRNWYGPVLVFATDPKNHVRRVQPEDASIARETITK